MRTVFVVGWMCGLGLTVSGCLFSGSADDYDPGPPPECRVDADCAHLDTDADECTTVRCESNKCTPGPVTNTTSCQCAVDDDCDRYLGGKKDCAINTCTAHKCSQEIAPAGPAPRQTAGDCATLTCDGVTTTGAKQIDPDDKPDAGNGCVIPSCGPNGEPAKQAVPDGTECGDGSVCYKGQCVACKPKNPAACKSEGVDEPKNDTGAGATSYRQGSPACGYTDGADIDWWTFFAKDADFTRDILRMHFWSTAPSMEACIYIKCEDGSTPKGGCSDLKPGPNGSQGCCYTGPPAQITPVWDLDCATVEDSGTVYVSVRTPGATTCESYIFSGSY
ncbi:MAG: hypothetical protein KIT84_07250 [Labilithrix sp.]|nr:hypothetical protein [Labilithrix sp.]MCW5810791.1 hypothetical protein [Labilithrix sp.]